MAHRESVAPPAAKARQFARAKAASFWLTLPVLFLLLLRFGTPPSLELDPTWSAVLRWAFAHGLRWGVDIVFTYGPLGFLTPRAAYYPGLERLFFSAQIVLALGQACVFALALRSLPRWTVLAMIAVLVIWLQWTAGDVAWYATFAFAFAAVVNGADEPPLKRWTSWVALCALLAAIALIKFTSIVIFVLWTSLLAGWLLWRRRPFDALAFAALAAAAYLAGWLGCGQTWSGLFAYLGTSLDVAGGYGAAMSMEADGMLEAVGVAALAMLVFALAWIGRTQETKATALFAFAFFAALSFIVWRAFFTRTDHWVLFFACVSLVPFAALSCEGERRDRRRSNSVAGIVAASSLAVFLLLAPAAPGSILREAGSTVVENLRILHKPGRFERMRRTEWDAQRASIKLPRIAQLVGAESVDMLMIEQGIVLGLELDYRPRPVFQSYSAYTPELLRINEAYFAGARAPRFAILKLQPIDGRYPMQEDGLALAMLFKRYRPRLIEAGYLLLERTDAVAAAIVEPPSSAYRTLRLGEKIELPPASAPQLLFVEARPSWLGRLRAFVLREPPLWLNLRTATGRHMAFRLLRRGVQSGFMVSPILRNVRDWVHATEANPELRAAQLSIEAPAWSVSMFERDMRIAIVPLAGPFAADDHSEFEESMAYPGFSQPASDQSAAFDVVSERGRSAVFMHAPAWIEFSLGPGAYRASGALGLLERMPTSPGCGKDQADGVTATLSLGEEGAAPRILWQARIDPFAAPAYNEERVFASEPFHVQSPATLRVEFGAGNNNVCDWSYLRDLQITPAP